MKKMLAILMLFVTITTEAQEKTDSVKQESREQIIDMNRTFSVGGKALLCLRSNDVDKKDLKALQWTLTNDRIGNKNHIVLDVINARDNSRVAHQMWSDGVDVRMKIKDGKPTVYEVYDEMFSHLRLMAMDGVWIILFYSEIKKQ